MTQKGGNGGEIRGHLNFLSQQELVCGLPLRLNGVMKADKQRKGHSKNYIQLYLWFLLCCSKEFPSLNTLLALLSCSYPLCSPLSVYTSPFVCLCSALVACFLLSSPLPSMKRISPLLLFVFSCVLPHSPYLFLFVASSLRSSLCPANTLHGEAIHALWSLNVPVIQYIVGVLSILHLYSSMKVCCSDFFASQSHGLLQNTYCFSLRNFCSALNVNSVYSTYKVKKQTKPQGVRRKAERRKMFSCFHDA